MLVYTISYTIFTEGCLTILPVVSNHISTDIQFPVKKGESYGGNDVLGSKWCGSGTGPLKKKKKLKSNPTHFRFKLSESGYFLVKKEERDLDLGFFRVRHMH